MNFQDNKFVKVISITTMTFYKFQDDAGLDFYVISKHSTSDVMALLHVYYASSLFKERAAHLEALFESRRVAMFLAFVSTIPDEFVETDLKWVRSLVKRQFTYYRIYVL